MVTLAFQWIQILLWPWLSLAVLAVYCTAKHKWEESGCFTFCFRTWQRGMQNRRDWTQILWKFPLERRVGEVCEHPGPADSSYLQLNEDRLHWKLKKNGLFGDGWSVEARQITCNVLSGLVRIRASKHIIYIFMYYVYILYILCVYIYIVCIYTHILCIYIYVLYIYMFIMCIYIYYVYICI